MKCADCKWWGAERRHDLAHSLGTCRSGPPGLTQTQTLANAEGRTGDIARGLWAWTAFDDFCGAYAPRKDRQDWC